NEAVLAELRTRNALLHQEDYSHSYPHCWRSKTPIIFRAMDQWFIEINHAGFRDQALTAINRINWVPDWGKTRIEGAVKSRPDWCISRQRTWGVPIPAFYDKDGQALLDARIVRRAADLVEQHGSNIWFEKSAEELWRTLRPADWKGAEAVSKSADTLDVWIDSGSSSRAVLMRRAELKHKGDAGKLDWQADIYLEGSDQHRGWFQSSLLLSLAGNGAPPYKSVLAQLESDVAAAFDAHEFHVMYQKISQFAAVELSAIYHDVVKDRLYTDAARSPRRRSTQTALYRMVTRLCQMLSPVLTFTADEAWEFVPGKAVDSVHLGQWKPAPFQRNKQEGEACATMFRLREVALAELEKARQNKLIGKALEAKLLLTVPPDQAEVCGQQREALRELCNVSQLELASGHADTPVSVSVTKAEGQKCER